MNKFSNRFDYCFCITHNFRTDDVEQWHNHIGKPAEYHKVETLNVRGKKIIIELNP